jgi:DNA polymerase-4
VCAGRATPGRRGRTIAIKVRLDDFTTVTRARTLGEATCDVKVVSEVALSLLHEYSPPRPVRLLGVRVAGLSTEGAGEPGVVAGAAGARAPADQLALPV